MNLFADDTRSAEIDGPYRYTLTRRWERDGPHVLFIAHNPSTASATSEDPTSKRFLGFARSWGFASYTTVNIAAYMATDKRELAKLLDPFGPRNAWFIDSEARKASKVLVCCGTPSWPKGREVANKTFVRLAREHTLYALGGSVALVTKDGFPQHPLYQPADLCPVVWRMRTS